MDTVLQTKNLSKRYKNCLALDNVSIQLEKGRIYGLVGNNGAGKSTLLQIIAGVIKPTEGSYSLFESDTERKNRLSRRKVGFLLNESSWLSENMTALQNLVAIQKLIGYSNRNEAECILSRLGLVGSKVQRERIRTFSTGQRQRVAIAATLLHQPELLVLDEPFVGLDLETIQTVNDFLCEECATRGMTILLSSHNLPQLYNIATDYIFLHHGKILESIDADTLRARRKYCIFISADPLEKACALIRQVYPNQCVEIEGGRLKLMDSEIPLLKLETLLKQEGINVQELTTEGSSLEDYFVNLLGESV